MDAISYLLGRHHKSPKLLSGACLAISVLAWLNVQFLEFFDARFPEIAGIEWVQILMGLFYTLSFVGGAGAVLLVLVALPISHWAKATSTLRSWSENRVLEEFAVTGISQRALLDNLAWFYIKRTILVAIPTLAFTLLAWQPYSFSILEKTGTLTAMLFSALGLGFALFVWKTSAGPKGTVLMLPPLLVLALPSLGVCYAWTSAPGLELLDPSLWIVLLPYTIVAARSLSIFALERKSTFEGLVQKLQYSQLKSKRPELTAENAIIARQQMLGRGFSGKVACLVVATILGLSAWLALTEGNAIPIYVSLVVAGMLSAWRAAARLSQSLTQELESSTLETVRTTPLGSERFLKGWLEIAVRPLTKEVAVFSLLALPLCVLAEGITTLTSGHFFNCVLLALLAPYLGGLFGASIAGQCRPRQEISGQLTATAVIGGLCCIPQMMIILSEDFSWSSFVMTLVVARLAIWLLGAGAKKSLNRVFLPQK